MGRIANIIGVSRSTLYRRIEEEDIPRAITYSDISDHNLDQLIRRIKLQHQHDGEHFMCGHLVRYGIRVQRSCLRASIHRVDPINTQLRRSIAIRRRRYHTTGPNAVWHIDGNHMMIRWHLVIHGGIDGFSRTVVFLKCSDNNRANTVLQSFICATESHGVPNKIRTDCGGENVAIWRHMIRHHSSQSAVITGSSTHNERIERLWRDVTRSVDSIFINAFRSLEDEGKHDPLNDLNIFCLHWVYLPLINKTLEEFRESWNHHPLSSEHNQTPNQLFFLGMLSDTCDSPSQLSSNPFHSPTVMNTVDVSTEKFRACPALKVTLQSLVNPSLLIDDAISKYVETQTIVGHHILNGCNHCDRN